MSDKTFAEQLEDAKVRVRAKAFACRLRRDNWAEFIPTEDCNSFTGQSQLDLYTETLMAKRCVQREDNRWEFKR